MAGTKEGGIKARNTNLKKDPNFYKKIGSVGGKNGRGHKFGHGKIDPSVVGRVGGLKSRRGTTVKSEGNTA